MGLDMYLKAEKYVSGYDFSSDKEKGFYQNICSISGADAFKDPETPSLTVNINVAYWRKANHIHVWFVKNVQNDVDDCGTYYVSREQLNTLLEICKEVMVDNSKAEELLPPQSGFFGSTEIDEWYFRDIEYTISIIDKLKKHLPENWSIYYHSSW